MNDSLLQRKARECILAGRMPEDAPTRVWGGQGLEMTCPVCSEPVQRADTGFELEFDPRDGDTPRSYALHVRCFFAWEGERERLVAGDARQGRAPLPQRSADVIIAGRAQRGSE